jgi:hypothetical protein
MIMTNIKGGHGNGQLEKTQPTSKQKKDDNDDNHKRKSKNIRSSIIYIQFFEVVQKKCQ